MATTYYQMDQHRFISADQYLEDMEPIQDYEKWQISDSSPVYKDALIKLPSGKFTKDESYYLSFEINKSINYSLGFSLKFLDTTTVQNPPIYSETGTSYQFIRFLEVLKTGSTGMNSSLICMYKIRNVNNPKTAISNESLTDKVTHSAGATVASTGVFFVNHSGTYFPNVLYYDSSKDEYFLPGTQTVIWGSNNQLEGANDAILNWSWSESESSSEEIKAVFNLVVTPRHANYDAIVLQMKRIQEDSNIKNVDGTSGRFVELNNLKLKHIFNLNDAEGQIAPLNSQGKPIKRIGIWGHPELLLAIDGEMVQIGPSGYYELNGHDIYKLGVVAEGPQDTFVLDYQYEA